MNISEQLEKYTEQVRQEQLEEQEQMIKNAMLGILGHEREKQLFDKKPNEVIEDFINSLLSTN